MERVPDEFYQWVKLTKENLEILFATDLEMYTEEYNIVKQLPTRKEQALAIAHNDPTCRSVVFALLDGKDPAPIIWKNLRPEYAKPFRKDIDL